MDLIAWAPFVLLVLAVPLLKMWIKAGVEKSVQHIFDAKLDTLRSDLRQKEEAFKADLQAKQVEISSLRDGVLNGRATRQTLVDKRRLEAIERLWTAVVDLGPYKYISAVMAVVNFDAAAKRAPHDPELRKVFEMFANPVRELDKILPNKSVRNEQPFVSPIAWAFFSAFQAALYSAHARLKALEAGIDEPDKLLDVRGVATMLKAALPHRAEIIDRRGAKAFHGLLDELEGSLLTEIKKMLDGAEIDQASIAQSAAIMDKVNQIAESHDQAKAEKVASAV